VAFISASRRRTSRSHATRRSAAGDEPRTPRLTRRFAAYAAIALLVGGGATFLIVRSESLRRAERQSVSHTKFIAESILTDRLRVSDFERPLTAARVRALDRLFREEVLVDGALRAKLYARDGLTIYSTDHTLIGRRSTDRSIITRAAAGLAGSDISRLNSEGGSGGDRKVLEAYVPASVGEAKPTGVFELYQDYAPITAAARDEFMQIGGIVAAMLLVLYVSFFPILRRVTSRMRRQMAHIEHQSSHDALTELPNRILFHDRVGQALLSARRRDERVAVMLIDLDRFKEVNDTLGHRSGDLLLQQVGTTMRTALRASDTVARLGGDEFAVLAPAISGPDAAIALAQKLLAALLSPQEVAGVELEVDASVGISLFPDHGDDVDTLLQRADVAMYLSKETHTPTVYAPEHDHYSPRRLKLMSQLRRAIADEELLVYYQPQADLQSGEIRGVEALVRWQHPTEGLLGPDAFIPLAEHIGLIRPLTLFVLNQTLRQCRTWRDAGIDLCVAVNITGRDLMDLRLPTEVEELLDRWQIEPDRLELEITENTVLSDPTRAREILTRLHELGVRLAIDDFGAGNSSLGYLKRLPIESLKIDKSFVLNMRSDLDDAVIVKSTIELGHNLGLSVVAEGVEDSQAWQQLLELGCDTVQGYYLARPGPPERITAMLTPPVAAAAAVTASAHPVGVSAPRSA
jgi:diguanylate cyclase (GGDEF)-like protein